VREEIDKSEGRMGTNPAGNFLDYPTAYAAAHGRGIQGDIGTIVIMSPDGIEDVTALRADGTLKVVDRVTRWRTVGLTRRLRFPNRPATNPDA
jgi:hypothetical protein